MAEALALHGAKLVASPIISGLLKEGFSYLGIDVSTNLQDLETTILPQFQLVIEAAERSSEHKSKLEQWLRKLKIALYEAEDVIDLYKYQLLEEKVSDLNTHSALKSLKKVALKVNTGLSILSPQKIKLRKSLNKLEMIAAEAKTFRELLGMRIGDSTTTHDLENRQQPNVTTSIPPSKVFGRDKERDEIIDEYFLDKSEAFEVGKSYSVVSITGIGGAGKSTLAQLVYNDQRVINHFDIKMWICVSRKLDVFRHTREMVESASKNECSRFENLDVLQSKFIDLIKSKKVLLVLDDVWYDKTVNEAEWENLLAPLVNVGKKGSKILVTTRIQNLPVALHPRYSMSLRDLEENVIISLFMHHAFGGAKLSDIHLQKELEGIGKQIVQKLHGSPLAVKAVGGQLSRRLEANFWKAALDRDNLQDTQQALLWSYRHLDAPLQHCFSYFSLFPKGRNFKVEEIVHLWMAEGFINSSEDSRRMEDVGMDYFNELVSGSFLQLGKSNAKFYMHDLFHDLAERISKEDCLRIEDNRVKEIPPTVRRLYISGEGMKENCISFDKLGNLRTLIIYGELDISVADHLTATVMKCKKLRILKLFYSNIKTLPKSIGDLKHLRYLFVDRTDAIESSVSLGKLYHLQVLTSHHSSLPRSLNNLINLRHVNGKNGALTAVPDIGRLTSLQTLELFDVKKEKGYDIGQLKNMNELHGSLTISSLENIESKEKAVEANLKDKEHLESLRLIWKNNNESDSKRDLDREVLESLQPHPNLINFSVEGYRSPSCPNWLLRRGCLQNLRSVEFKNCTSLEVLPPMGELFPHCQELRIWDLPNIRKIPLFSESLKELWLTRCSSLVFMSKEEVEKRSEDIFGGKEKIELILPSLLLSLTIWYCDITDAALSRSLEKLTHLKSLELTGIDTITIFPSEEILHHMVALTQLHIAYCPHLKSLKGLHALPSLGNLGIDACPCLELEMEMEMVMPGEDAGRSILPPSLRVLVIRRCARLKSFVVAPGDLPNLATLHIRDCPSLASLSLSRLTALTYLEIMECPELSSMSSNLPESLEEVNLRRCPSISSLPDLPKSLTRIGIFGCPALQERCRSPDGEDWPKIASIPHRCVW